MFKISVSQFSLLALILSFGLSVNLEVKAMAEGNSNSPNNNTPPIRWQAREFVPPDNGTPTARDTSGTRGPACLGGYQLGKPNVSKLNNNSNLATYPSLSWKLPKSTADSVELSLKDNQNNEIYTDTVSIDKNSGEIILDLTNLAKMSPNSLQKGQEYTWELTIVCNPIDRSGDVFDMGKIKL